jgi:hypothetical protein
MGIVKYSVIEFLQKYLCVRKYTFGFVSASPPGSQPAGNMFGFGNLQFVFS